MSDSAPPGELRLIVVKWSDRDTFNVECEADAPLQLARVASGRWSASVPTFPRICQQVGQLGVRCQSVPQLVLSDGKVRRFASLGETGWWVEKYKFVKEKNRDPYWESTLNAKAGRAVLELGTDRIDLTVLPSDWTWVQVLELEQDLQAVALKLLTEDRSSAQFVVERERRTVVFDRVCRAARQLTAASDEIFRSPITALRSSICFELRHKARPCPAGMIDAACRPERRRVRASIITETLNVPENRFVVYLLTRASALIRLLQSAVQNDAKSHCDHRDRLRREVAITPKIAPGSLSVDSGELDRECQILKKHLEHIRQWNSADRGTYEAWTSDRPTGPIPQAWLEKSVLRKLGTIEKSREKLAQTGWERPSRVAEREEYEAHLIALRSQLDLSTSTISALEKTSEALVSLDREIGQSLRRWDRVHVTSSSIIPASSALHARRPYIRATDAYRSLIREFGSRETADLLLQPPEIVSVGIVDLWLLFERWCLLQVVQAVCKVFKPADSVLIERVVRAALLRRDERSEHEVLHFVRDLLSCTVQLEPAMQTVAGKPLKYPDFRLEVHGGVNELVAILDAKCKRFSESLEGDERVALGKSLPRLSQEIRAMYFGPDVQGGERNYSMHGQNRVFVLHPCTNTVEPSHSLQQWSHRTYYGERVLYDWQESNSPNHEYGAVYLRPNETHDLERLLTLLVHAAIVPQRAGKIDESVQKTVPCATCGATLKWSPEKKTQGDRPRYTAVCSACQEYHVFTHCALCSQRLVKAGRHSTYHSLADTIGNIRCPRCQTALS